MFSMNIRLEKPIKTNIYINKCYLGSRMFKKITNMLNNIHNSDDDEVSLMYGDCGCMYQYKVGEDINDFKLSKR